MDAKKLSLHDIHESIESTLQSLKEQHKKLENEVTSKSHISEVVQKTLKPISKSAKVQNVKNLNALKSLLSAHETFLTHAKQTLSTTDDKSSITDDVIESNEKDKPKSKTQILPPVAQAQPLHQPKPRPPVSAGVRYPAINPAFTRTPTDSRGSPCLPSPFRRVTPPSHMLLSNHQDDVTSVKHEQLRRYVDSVEIAISHLQSMFTGFTQRVLVPLQTFCRPESCRLRIRTKKEVDDSEAEKQCSPHQNEFVIVETLNRIKQILWCPADGAPEQLFSEDGKSYEISSELNCEAFSIVCVIPDVLQKFSHVFCRATTWLKRDELYTENAKCGLYRSHRRYIKTERMYTEARETQRQLATELEHTNCDVTSNERRLDKLQNDIELLQNDMTRAQDQRRTVEIQLRDASTGMENLRTRHRALRKRINDRYKKLEARERNYEFMESRLRSLKTDQEALKEKIKISEEFSDSLHSKMVQLYRERDAWRRRYQEKTDPESLKRKYDTVGLRIPSPVVREKTFILKTRMENLRDAISIVSDRLKKNDIHWSVLCSHLRWPNQFLVALQKIHERTHNRDPVDSDSSSSSESSVSAGKLRAPPISNRSGNWDDAYVEWIIDYVKRHCHGKDSDQCLFMLKLWLRYSDKQASLEQLLKALHASRLSDVIVHLKPCVS